MGRWAAGLALALAGLAGLAWLGIWIASEPLPQGKQGPQADAFARGLERAVDIEAWRDTAVVHWVFVGRHHHTWDRTRGYSQVRWGGHEVMQDLARREGCAWTDGTRQRGETEAELLEDAYARFINDSFWLNPLGKLFDPGVERRLVDADGEPALLVTFTQNGLTPGDSYLWLRGESGRPRAWRMWTWLPIQGLEASWEDWTRLSSGAWIARRHAIWELDVTISELSAAEGAAGLPGVEGDPFARCDVLSRR